MTQRATERLYWRLSCAFLVFSPLAAYVPVRLQRPGSYVHGYFITAMFVGQLLPHLIVVAAAIFRRERLHLWLARPRVEGSHRSSYDVDEAERRVNERLTRLGFSVDARTNASDTILTFAKPKTSPVVAFADHAFSGTVGIKTFKAVLGGSQITGSLTLETTVILETGESGDEHALLKFILLERSDPGGKQVPLLVYTGSSLAFAVIVATAVAGTSALSTLNWALSMATAAASISLISLFFFLRDRTRLIGLRLVFIALVLCSVPWIARALNPE